MTISGFHADTCSGRTSQPKMCVSIALACRIQVEPCWSKMAQKIGMKMKIVQTLKTA